VNQVGFCLQDYTEMYGQQNITFDFNLLNFSHHSQREENLITPEEMLEGKT